MTRTHKRLIDRLDAVAERTGIPQAATGQPRRRHLRWLPLVPLGLGIGGFLLGLVRADQQSIGMALLMLGFGLSVLLPLLGPLKPWGTAERVDEFDRNARQSAYFFSFATISCVAGAGIWLLVGVSLTGNLPHPLLTVQLGQLGTLLLLLYFALPTLYASWSVNPIDDED